MLALLCAILLMPDFLLKRKSQPYTKVFNPILALLSSKLKNIVIQSNDRFIFIHVLIPTKEMLLVNKFATKSTLQHSMLSQNNQKIQQMHYVHKSERKLFPSYSKIKLIQNILSSILFLVELNYHIYSHNSPHPICKQGIKQCFSAAYNCLFCLAYFPS